MMWEMSRKKSQCGCEKPLLSLLVAHNLLREFFPEHILVATGLLLFPHRRCTNKSGCA